ncbi:hypothetical protein M3181_24875 [Mesobacillus maritimus]|uniref:hypothetical protein n=1 Tax=Mesobacillus maritimus TaxID=1643336 RepID=UPI00203A8C65|nr:hypothetical protein [Mesobacillus maritimus]MCM3672118.1 hypothetical protein [Mesobacillus maritimus]
MVKTLLIYILLSAIILIGYIGSYAISVVLFFFAIGALLLPIVVIGFPILIF